MSTDMPKEIKDKDVRWFGVIMLVGMGLIGGWLWLKAHQAGESAGATPIVLWCIGAVVCAAALAAPKPMRPVYRAWMWIGMAMGAVVGRVVLSLVFYVGITLTRAVMLCTGRDRLQRRFDPDASTYWEEREAHPPKERYARQF